MPSMQLPRQKTALHGSTRTSSAGGSSSMGKPGSLTGTTTTRGSGGGGGTTAGARTATASDGGGSSTAYYHSAASSFEEVQDQHLRQSSPAPPPPWISSNNNTTSGQSSLSSSPEIPKQSHQHQRDSPYSKRQYSQFGPPSPSPAYSTDPPSSSEEETDSANVPGRGDSPRSPKLQAASRRSGVSSRFGTAGDDYFSRHPDPDYSLRLSSQQRSPTHATISGDHHHPDASGSPGERAASRTRRDTDTRQSTSASEDWNRHTPAPPPNLTTGTPLSAGVLIGATMGGNERIFPIRSVVAPQTSKQTQQNQGQASKKPSSASGSTKSRDSHTAEFIETSSSHVTASINDSPQQQQLHHQRRFNGSIAMAPALPTSSSPPRYPSFSQSLAQNASADQFHESGTEYTRRSPMAEDTSDFSFAQPASPTTGKIPVKPRYRRYNSSASGQGSGPTILNSSYRTATTSRYSDDSDPTARRGDKSNTSARSTAMSRNTSSRLEEEEGGGRDQGSQQSRRQRRGIETKPSTHGKNNVGNTSDAESLVGEENDIIKKSKELYESGENEAGPSVDTGGLGSLGTGEGGLFVNVRFEHQETEEGHAILTGRKGELVKCEDEPIHIPGAIQDYGVLIAFEEDSEGNLAVCQVSEVGFPS